MTLRRITLAAAFAASFLVAPAAAAIPDPIGYPAPPSLPAIVPAAADEVQHPCFMVRSRWSNALDGPQPTCSASRPAH